MNASPLAPTQIVDGVVISVALRMVVHRRALLPRHRCCSARCPSAWGVRHRSSSALLAGLAFGTAAHGLQRSTIEEDKGQFAIVMRFVLLPMFLFSGTFFPLATLPICLQWIGWISPLWHATELARRVHLRLRRSRSG